MALSPHTGAGYSRHWLPFPWSVLKDALANEKLSAMGYLLTSICSRGICSTSQCSPNKKAHIDSSVCLVVKATPHWSKSETGSVQITAHRAHPTDLQITPSSSTTQRRGRDPFAKHFCNIQLFQNHRHTSYFLI